MIVCHSKKLYGYIQAFCDIYKCDKYNYCNAHKMINIKML
jgi:hypothetical protein